jgi:hypothetical protein
MKEEIQGSRCARSTNASSGDISCLPRLCVLGKINRLAERQLRDGGPGKALDQGALAVRLNSAGTNRAGLARATSSFITLNNFRGLCTKAANKNSQ